MAELPAATVAPEGDALDEGPGRDPQPLLGFLTVAEVAALAGVSVRAVRNRISSGKLAAERAPDGTWQIPADSARAYATGTLAASGRGSSRRPPAGADAETLAAALRELLVRYEAAVVRLNQLEVMRERLQLSTGELEERAVAAEAALDDARTELAAAQRRLGELHESPRRPWWAFWRSSSPANGDREVLYPTECRRAARGSRLRRLT